MKPIKDIKQDFGNFKEDFEKPFLSVKQRIIDSIKDV